MLHRFGQVVEERKDELLQVGVAICGTYLKLHRLNHTAQPHSTPPLPLPRSTHFSQICTIFCLHEFLVVQYVRTRLTRCGSPRLTTIPINDSSCKLNLPTAVVPPTHYRACVSPVMVTFRFIVGGSVWVFLIAVISFII